MVDLFLVRAGFIITCVAGLEQATLRMAGAVPDKQDIRTYKEDYEVTSLVGTVSVYGVHLHMSISDKEGIGFGGHLKEGTIIHLMPRFYWSGFLFGLPLLV